MALNDPFTLDLFSNTSLTSGLGLGVTAFPPAAEVGRVVSSATISPSLPAASAASNPAPALGENFHLVGNRGLAKSWRDRAQDNLAVIRLAAEIEADHRSATAEEQAQLIRFIGFGASELANGVFRCVGEDAFRKGWENIGEELEDLVDARSYASLARCTQYAHFTPEYIVRAVWAGIQRLGFRGGRVLEPGIGSGLFPALMPAALCDLCHVTGVELDPVSARIAKLLQPCATVLNEDFARAELKPYFDLAIGNPPFSDRVVRSDRAFRALGLRLHDYFIAKSIDRLKPGGLAAFVTSAGTMDKANASARQHIATMADPAGAIRLPEGSFRADAGTDVVVDILFFRKRRNGEPAGGGAWLDLAEIRAATENDGTIRINRYFAEHLRTDALHEALGRAPIEDDMLLALLVLAFAGQNVSIASGNAGGFARLARHAAQLIDKDGKLAFERESVQQAARAVLMDVLSCRENRSDSGVVARVAGDAVGADSFLPNMGTEDFLSCLSRTALEVACKDTPVLPRPRVKDTRAELVKHFSDGRFVHHAARFAPSTDKVVAGSSAIPRPTRTSSTRRLKRLTIVVARTPQLWLRISPPMTTSRSLPAPMPSRPNSPLSFRTIYAVGSGRWRFCFHNLTQEDIMSAQTIYDRVPLGSLVRYFDGTPRPPERFKRKLAAWENNNNGGRLVRKSAPHTVGTHTTPASITLHQGDFGSAGVVMLRVFKTFSVDTALTFTLIERPKPGMVRVLDRAGEDAELLHLADGRAAAEAWFATHRHPGAVIDEVTAHEAAGTIEGRAA